MVYTDVVLSPDETSEFDTVVIDLTGQYFIPTFVIQGFRVKWREKADGSFTKMALSEVFTRVKKVNKGSILVSDDNLTFCDIPWFATYDSKKNEMTCYYFRPDDENRHVVFHTFQDEYVEVSFKPMRHLPDGEGGIEVRLIDGLDLRYMMAKTVSLCQKKVLSVSCKR